MTLVKKNRAEILRKTIFCGIQRVFLLAMLILGITFTKGMVADADAVVHFSRACAFGTNESGTHNFSAKLGGWFWVNSLHYNFNYGTKRWEYKHYVPSRWNGPNGTINAQRAVAGHGWPHSAPEIFSYPWSAGVIGKHYQWYSPNNTVNLVWTTNTRTCIDF